MADTDMTLRNDRTLDVEPSIGFKRVSWGAIFAGFVIAMVTHLALMLLGLGIGASTIDPLAERNPLSGIGIGSGIWFAVVTLIALYAGGWVAGRLSGVHTKVDGSVHGLLAWGVSSLAVAFMVFTAVTSVVGTTAAMVGQGAAAVGRGVSAAGSSVADVVQNQLGQAGIDITSIRNEINALLAQGGGQEMQTEFFAVIDNAFMDETPTTLEAEDKQAIMNFMTTRMNMSEADATATVNRWEQAAQTAQTRLADAQATVAREAREAGDAAAAGVSRAAIWSFIAMLLGAIAAAFGGMLGATKGDFTADYAPRRSDAGLGRPAYQA